MGRQILTASNSMQELTELLHAARWKVVKDSTSAELLRLVPLLEQACEGARVVALGNFRWSGGKVSPGGAVDRTFGFAELYSALRRARAEIRRREAARNGRSEMAAGDCGTVVRFPLAHGRSSASPHEGPP